MSTGQLSNPNLKDAQKATFAASVAVQTYVASILRQGTMELPEMPNLRTHQEVARQHALRWNIAVLPELIKTNAHIIDYSNQFNAYYVSLIRLADTVSTDLSARTQFIEGLTLLRRDIVNKKQHAMSAKISLQNFKEELSADHTTFLADAAEATRIFEGTSGDIAKLSSEIDKVQTSLNNCIGAMAGGAVSIVVGAVLIFVGTAATIETAGLSTGLIMAGVGLLGAGITTDIASGADYGLQVRRLATLKEELAADKQGLMGVKTVKGQLDGLVSQLTQAVASVDGLIRQWSDLDSAMETVLHDIERTPGTYGPPELKAILDRASQDWNETLSLALRMQPSGQLPTEEVAQIWDVINTGA